MHKITFRTLLLILCGILPLSIVKAQSLGKKPVKPNIIFILTDDLGYGDLGVFFQNQRKQQATHQLPYQLTPNLDKMAENGARFTHQYSNAPVCAPSRASLLTGVNQGNASVRDNQFDKQIENNHNMATLLKGAGYATAAVGKWGLQGETKVIPNWPAHPLKRGFDNFFGYMRHADGHEHYPFEGLYRGKKEVWENYKDIAGGLSKCYTTDLWTAYAKKWIIEHEHTKGADKPFFMFLAYDAPHAVLELPTQQYPAGGGLNGGLQWTGKSGNMINTASGNIDTYVHPDYANTTWPDTYKRYATANRRIDDAVGDLLKLLQDLKISDNTIVIFTSDNGPSIESYLPAAPYSPQFFGSYGPFDGIKRDVLEGGLRMPTLALWPGRISSGKVIAEPSMLSDWMATFADAAHANLPARSNGVSLLPVLTGKGRQEKSLIYSEYFEGGKTPAFKEFEASRQGRKRGQMQMIRIGDLVGVRYQIKSETDDFEIYDVVKDPKETNNLGLNNNYKVLQEQMKAKVLQLRKADKEAPRPYDKALIPAIALTKQNKLLPGLSWKFFKGSFGSVVSEKKLPESGKGTIKNILPVGRITDKGMTVYEGLIKVAADGEYHFALSATGRAYMRIHEAELIDADFGYQSGSREAGSVYLKAGYHPIKLYYLKENDKGPLISLKSKYGNTDWQELKVSDLYRLSPLK
ncbi:sulfatase-like hydrolase/transferase [Pedobacter frigoris]|uniref:DUF4976 domain-containing protein n=1 Tax=Pedobacter frigoris TaxID=2571272 RepID=A0A4U1CL24_9SPHI|nr:sulfatase-like hydrolase/transferase [Pedobacter frigoris]TKC06139.1 DUF4976 domain-containing protein [Pedobacter frigoris]